VLDAVNVEDSPRQIVLEVAVICGLFMFTVTANLVVLSQLFVVCEA
jgi:hypothetical protein